MTHSLFDIISGNGATDVSGQRVYGVVVGIVTNNQDPEKLGRVKIRFPWLAETDESNWARIVNLMGSYHLPEIDDEVLVVFDRGDINYPYVLGCLWNGVDIPPEANNGGANNFNENGENNIRFMRSRSGHQVVFDDSQSAEKIEIIDQSNQLSITIDSASGVITIEAKQGDIKLAAPTGKVLVDAQSIELNASKSVQVKSQSQMKIQAGSSSTVQAAGTMVIKGATVRIN